MMSDTIDTIEVHANVIMTTASLKAIVENTKKFTEPGREGALQGGYGRGREPHDQPLLHSLLYRSG